MMTQRRILYFQVPSSPLAFSEACFSLTPKVAVFSKEIFLEIGCTEKLFGGEKAVLFNAQKLAEHFRFRPQLVLTDRPEWARAFAGDTPVIIPPGKSQQHLMALPIERLALCGDPVHLEDEMKEREYITGFMRRVGMRTIADFARLPEISINRRFGKTGLLLHDWVSGRREVILPLFTPSEKVQEKIDCEEISGLEALFQALENPLLRISMRLYGRSVCAKKLLLRFSLENRKRIDRELVLTEATRNAASLHRIVKECLQGSTWDAPLVGLDLEVTATEKYQMGQLSLFDDSVTKNSELAEYVGRLRARFGDEAVGFPAVMPSYLPEKSWKNTWPPHSEKPYYPVLNRPLFLFDPPKTWAPSPVWHFLPSENISVEWWEGDGYRKYFIALNKKGERLWVFWTPVSKRWFLHGTW